MQTNEFGDKGYYVNKLTGKPCSTPSPTPGKGGSYDTDKCYFDRKIRSQAAVGSYGVPIHTFKQEQGTDTTGLPVAQKPMWGGCFKNSVLEKVESKIPGVDPPKKTTFVDIPKDKCIGPDYVWKPDYLRKDDEFADDKTLGDVLDEINNGRVGDVGLIDRVTTTSLGDVTMKQDNQETAVKGLIEESALSNIYFSEANTKVLQDTIRYDVFKRTNLVIDYQSPKELYIVMRSIMLQHANFKVGSNDLLREIHHLNKLVVKYCGKEIGSNVLQHQGYIKDLERIPIPLNRPGFTARKWTSHDLSLRNDLYSDHTYTIGGVTHRYQAKA